MKKQLFFALIALTISNLQADYGVYGSMGNASRGESLAPEHRMERSGFGAPYTRNVYLQQYEMENAPYGRNPVIVEERTYETYPATYRPGPIRRTAEDVVTGAETILEAPLNLIP